MAGWAIGLAALIGAGSLPADSPSAPPAHPPLAADAARGLVIRSGPRPGWVNPHPPASGIVRGSVVTLGSPPPAPHPVTTARLQVSGEMLVRAARVDIGLEALGKTLDAVSVGVADPDGGIRPAHPVTFDASFDLPAPRPTGTLWVVVTAFDAVGRRLGDVRRPVSLGPVAQPGAWGATGDGVPPWCSPEAFSHPTSC